MSAEEEILSPAEIEDEVLYILPTLDVCELEKIYTLLELECTKELKGKKCNLLKYLLQYLCDVDSLEDGGLSNMLLIHRHLNKER